MKYVDKIKRLIEHLEKIADKKLNIQITSTNDEYDQKRPSNKERPRNIDVVKQANRLERFNVHLRRKSDKYEWMEVAINSNINTKRTFRIMFSWLVASSIKIEMQIKLLQKRCSQYGLNLVRSSYSSSHSNLYLHPVR